MYIYIYIDVASQIAVCSRFVFHGWGFQAEAHQYKIYGASPGPPSSVSASATSLVLKRGMA